MIRSSNPIDKDDLVRRVDRADAIILDVGCYDGKDSFEFLDRMDRATVHAFDPAATILIPNDKIQKYSGRLYVYPMVLTNTRGLIRFFTSNHYQSSSINRPHTHLELFPEYEFDSDPVWVVSETLDNWVSCNLDSDRVIDILWVDVNGGEREFLSGAASTLSNRVRYLVIEVSDKELYRNQPIMDEVHHQLNSYARYECIGVFDFLGNWGNALYVNRSLEQKRE